MQLQCSLVRINRRKGLHRIDIHLNGASSWIVMNVTKAEEEEVAKKRKRNSLYWTFNWDMILFRLEVHLYDDNVCLQHDWTFPMRNWTIQFIQEISRSQSSNSKLFLKCMEMFFFFSFLLSSIWMRFHHFNLYWQRHSLQRMRWNQIYIYWFLNGLFK